MDTYLNGNLYTGASFQGQAYADEDGGFLPCLRDVAAHCEGIFRGSSTSTLTVGSGAKSLTITLNRPIYVNSWVRIEAQANSAIAMEGPVTAYNPLTGALSVSVDGADVSGAGTLSAWTIYTMGRRGQPGNAGTLATNNVAGVVALATQAEVDGRTAAKAVTADKLAEGLGIKGANISGGSLPAVGDYFEVAGGGAISQITPRAAGRTIRLSFSGSTTLIHGSFIVLPGGNNIVTAGGDVAELISEGSGLWRLARYQSYAQSAFPGLSLVSRQVISSPVAQVDFTSVFASAAYDTYRVQFSLFQSAASGLQMRFGDGSFATAGYYWAYSDINSVGGTAQGLTRGQDAAQVSLMMSSGSALSNPVSGEIIVDRPATGISRSIRWDLAFQGSPDVLRVNGACARSSSFIDRLRLYFSSGNISAGIVSIYGMRNA